MVNSECGTGIVSHHYLYHQYEADVGKQWPVCVVNIRWEGEYSIDHVWSP